jgi:hypothetical protein
LEKYNSEPEFPEACHPERGGGTLFSCFTGTKLQILTQKALQGRPVPPLAAPFVRLLLLTGVVKLGHERNAQVASL